MFISDMMYFIGQSLFSSQSVMSPGMYMSLQLQLLMT